METLKRFFRKKSNIVMTAVIALIVLGGVFGASAMRGNNSASQKEEAVIVQETSNSDVDIEEGKADIPEMGDVAANELNEETVDSNVQEDTSSVISSGKTEDTSSEAPSKESQENPATTPSTKPTTPSTKPTTPEATPAPDPVPEKKTCTISISCESILSHMDQLTAGKESCVPANGSILSTKTMEFSEGETVFDVLVRACKTAGIQLEYSYSPVYGSYYIEGIHNLYEFDCGKSSGWKYKVNGTFPNYGCSSYELSSGDKIVWTYTCGNE